MRDKIKILDIIIIFSAAAVTFCAVYYAYIKPRGQTQVLIQSQEGRWLFPVNARETVAVKGVIGDTIIKIDENRAWIESSPCDNKTCVASGFISRQGQWAACLPNNVLLMLFGAGEESGENHVDSAAW